MKHVLFLIGWTAGLLALDGCGKDCALCCIAGGTGKGPATCQGATANPDSSMDCESSADCADCSGCTQAATAPPVTELAAIPLVLLPVEAVDALERGELVHPFRRGGFTISGLSPWDEELLLTPFLRERYEAGGRTVLRVETRRGVTYLKGRFVVDRERGVVSVLTLGLAAVTWDGMSEAERVRYEVARGIWLGLSLVVVER